MNEQRNAEHLLGQLEHAERELERLLDVISELRDEQATGVLAQVGAERRCQDIKWGQQDHDPRWWNAILGEECGEVQKEIAESRLHDLDVPALRAELVQVAAVAVAWVEALDRAA